MNKITWGAARLKQHLTRELTWVISSQLQDPRIPEVFTITELKLSVDKKNVTVWISFFSEKNEQIIEILNKASPFIQHLVSEKTPIKYFPKLYFKLDNSLEKKQHFDDIFEQIKDDLV